MLPKPPSAVPIRQAIDDSAALASLARRLRESNARFDTIRPVLPPALAPHVRPGPLDDAGWCLLAANAAVAAKLRHLMPRVEAALKDAGCESRDIKVRVRSA